MTKLYENSAVWKRTIGFGVFLFLVFLWGLWELWSAWGSSDATSGAMWGVLFAGGAIFAAYQQIAEWRDVVTRLARNDATGALTATVWAPTGPLTLTGAPGEFTNWRPYVKTSGRMKTFYIYVDFARHPRTLRFDIGPKGDLTGLREIAPDVVAEFETTSGRAPAA
jgi:hypothetical protein